jgi:hypothetical protein
MIGLKILWGIHIPLLISVLNFLLTLEIPGIFLLGLAIFGWVMPNLYIQGERKKRILSVQSNLPFYADLWRSLQKPDLI